QNGIRASGGAKNCRYKDNTVIDNNLPVSEPPSDPAGRNDGLIITESSTGNNFEGNEVLNGAPDDGIALNLAKTNCIVNNKVDRCGGTPTPFNPDGTGACELISSTNNRIDCNVFTNCVNGSTPSNCCHASGTSTGNTGCNANFCPAMPVCTGTCAPCPP